jgi:hypothetical protein
MPSLPTGAWLVLDLARVTWTGLAWLGTLDRRVFVLLVLHVYSCSCWHRATAWCQRLSPGALISFLTHYLARPEESPCENMVTRPTTYDARMSTSVRVCALPISLYVVSIEAPFRFPFPLLRPFQSTYPHLPHSFLAPIFSECRRVRVAATASTGCRRLFPHLRATLGLRLEIYLRDRAPSYRLVLSCPVSFM